MPQSSRAIVTLRARCCQRDCSEVWPVAVIVRSARKREVERMRTSLFIEPPVDDVKTVNLTKSAARHGIFIAPERPKSYAEPSENSFARFGIILETDAAAINISLLRSEELPLTFLRSAGAAIDHKRRRHTARTSRTAPAPVLSSVPSGLVQSRRP